jgi:hypothetical protein
MPPDPPGPTDLHLEIRKYLFDIERAGCVAAT